MERVLTLYWSIFSLACGACIGSFLNVVIYRWPRGLSVRRPVRSFCPACQNRIAWYDNVPVASYLRLRGRCRHCGARISLQYPIVELATAMAFLMIYDAFFVARLRLGVGELFTDFPILIAHWALVAGLIAVTVMDLEAYMVDIRVTWLVSLAGVVGHVFWTPPASREWIRPGALQAGWVWAGVIGFALGAWWMLRRQSETAIEESPVDDSQPSPPGDASMSSSNGAPSGGFPSDADPSNNAMIGQPPAPVSLRWLWLMVPLGLVLAYALAMAFTGPAGEPMRRPRFWLPLDDIGQIEFQSAGMLRVGLGLVLLFLALTAAASEPREQADAQIVEAIEFEAVDARRMALWELKLIAPAVLLGGVVLWLLSGRPAAADAVGKLLDWRAWDGWRPMWGLSTGLAGWLIGGAIGWLARILFTLLFGKEALGMGDVHILAAAGAVAGWPVAFFGFFIGAMLALLGLLVIRLRRQSRMLPYGPWLGLGFFLAAMFQDVIFEYLNVRWLFESR
ncbi:MAG: hypothetical protein AMXMBFR83_19190 [Phycisphaerae bacterium]